MIRNLLQDVCKIISPNTKDQKLFTNVGAFPQNGKQAQTACPLFLNKHVGRGLRSIWYRLNIYNILICGNDTNSELLISQFTILSVKILQVAKYLVQATV